VGADFVFGYKRSGNVQLLKKLGTELKFAVHGMSAVSLDGKAVSSTWIREQIAAGDLDAVSQMLGRSYSIAGTVTRGDALGKDLGFPTANLDTTGLALPPNGVYMAHARFDSQTRQAVVNIGFRPTVAQAQPQLRVEAHLLNFDGDFYGRELELVFVEKLRDERKFPSVVDLQAQIARDIQNARSRF
jgi:riboflavin kinase/FMN adenylyltransferase